MKKNTGKVFIRLRVSHKYSQVRMRVCSCTVLSERYKLTGSWGIAQGEESLIFLTAALDLRSVRCLDCASALVRLPLVPSVLLKRRPQSREGMPAPRRWAYGRYITIEGHSFMSKSLD